MGAYYKPVNTDKQESLYSWDYDNGLKLWEHSYINNNFVGIVCALLMDENAWKHNRVRWACDYTADSPEFIVHSNNKSQNSNAYDWANEINPDVKPVVPRYIYNLDKMQYVDTLNLKRGHKYSETTLINHPLPLLVAEGVNMGGGSYTNWDPENQAGSWCGDRIGATNDTGDILEMEELIFDVGEDEPGHNIFL